MFNVSEEYLKAIEQPVRNFKTLVRFNYQKAPQAEFEDDKIIGEMKIESQAVSGSSSCGIIDIGAVPSATAELTIIDDATDLHRYAGASFAIYVFLQLENGEYERVPMGNFFCDTSKMSRVDNRINVFGYDAMTSLNYTLPDTHRLQIQGKTACDSVRVLVARGRCGFDQDLSGFPNSDVSLDFSSPQIVTSRDAIMWIAQLMGCFARINRHNFLEFVPIKSTWEWFNDDHTLGTIIAARNINDKARYKTKFLDDRIHIVGVSMPDKNNKLITRSGGGLADDSNIIVPLEKNPLIASSEKPLTSILDDILTQLQTAYFYAFSSEITSDPALDAGDTVRLKGGVINGTNKNNDLIGFITHNVWRYRGKHEVINTGQTPIVYCSDTQTAAAACSDETAVNTYAVTSENDGSYYAPPRAQSEKLLDSLTGSTSQLQERVTVIEKGGGSGGQRDRIIASNGNAWVARPAFSGTGGSLVCFDTSNDGVAEINAATNLHPYQYEDKMPRYNGTIQIQSRPGIFLNAKTVWGSESTQGIIFEINGDYVGHGLGISADSTGGLVLWGNVPLPRAKMLPNASNLSFELHITPEGKATITIGEGDVVGSIKTKKNLKFKWYKFNKEVRI